MIEKTLVGPIFKDNLNRADDDDPGPDYEEIFGDWDIISDRLQVTTAGFALLGILIDPRTDVFIQTTASNNLIFGHNPGLAVKLVNDGGGVDLYEFRYDSGFGNIRMYRITNSGGPVQLGGTGPGGGTTGGAGHMQFWVSANSLKGRFWDGGAWKTMTRTDGVFAAILGMVGLVSRGVGGSKVCQHDNPIVMADPWFRTTYAGLIAPGWKVRVLDSSLATVITAANVGGVALPDITTVTPSIPQAGFPWLRILDSTDRAIDELEGEHYPGEQFTWDGAAKFYAPTLTAQPAPTGLGIISITAADHLEGVTTEAGFGEGNDLPYPKHFYARIATSAAPTVTILEIESPPSVLTLDLTIEGLAPGSYVVRGAWYDGKYGQLGVLSSRVTMVIAAEVTEPSDEEEGVTYNVSSSGCKQYSVVLEPWTGAGTEIGIWWKMGRAAPGGETFQGYHSEVPTSGNFLTRNFPLLETGVRNMIGWRRIISVGGQWRLTIEHRVWLDACDDVPIPFWVTPPGGTYDADFDLEFEYRGPVDFWTGNAYTHRIELSSDKGASWAEQEADFVGLTYTTDFVAGLAAGLHLIRVTTKSEDTESRSAVFAFYKGDPADSTVADFKAMVAMPAGEAVWAGAGTGTDRTDWTHVPGVGVVASRDVQNPVDQQPSAFTLTDFGLPRAMRGVLTFSARIPNESWAGAPKVFAPTLFQKLGLGFCVGGTGADKTAWHGIMLRQASGWQHGWGYSGNTRAAGNSASRGGVNLEFNRVNFGSSGPYVYGITSDLKSEVQTKRVGLTTFGSVGAGAAVAASRWYPTNRVSGQHTFIFVFEMVRVSGGYELSFLIAGPGANPDGWMVEGLVVSDGGGEDIPCGSCALLFSGPMPAGDAVFHSLVGEVTDDCADECPPLENEPAILEVTVDREARTILVRGNEPVPNDEGTFVRYRLFLQGEYDEALEDSDWIVWSADGYEFGPLAEDQGCFVIEYAWADPCGTTIAAPLRQASLPSTGGC